MNKVLSSTELTPAAKVVYVVLTQNEDATRQELLSRTGQRSMRNLARCLAELKAAGLIKPLGTYRATYKVVDSE